MEGLRRARAVVHLMPVAVTLLASLPGCGGDTDDLSRGRDPNTLKTPGDVLKAAQAKNANLPPVVSAPQGGRSAGDIQRAAQSKNAALRGGRAKAPN